MSYQLGEIGFRRFIGHMLQMLGKRAWQIDYIVLQDEDIPEVSYEPSPDGGTIRVFFPGDPSKEQ